MEFNYVLIVLCLVFRNNVNNTTMNTTVGSNSRMFMSSSAPGGGTFGNGQNQNAATRNGSLNEVQSENSMVIFVQQQILQEEIMVLQAKQEQVDKDQRAFFPQHLDRSTLFQADRHLWCMFFPYILIFNRESHSVHEILQYLIKFSNHPI